MELVKDKATKEPFEEAGKLVYQKAFRKGLAWIPAGHILRMSPPLIMEDDLALKGLAILYQKKGFLRKSVEMWERALYAAPDVDTRQKIRSHLFHML